MENMTELSSQMYQSAVTVQSVPQAVAVLKSSGSFRTLGDVLRSYAGCDNPKNLLVEGLLRNHPEAGRDSVDKKVRNWLSGRTRTIGKRDAFELCQILGLDLERADAFLRLVVGEGIHWRDAEEIIWGYAILHGLGYGVTCALLSRAPDLEKRPKAAQQAAPESFTADVRAKLQPVLYRSPDELLEYLGENRDALGTLHNTAYQLFMQYMQLLETGGIADGLEDGEKMSSRQILEQYMYRHLTPVAKRGEAKDKSAFSDVQRSIRMNWPDEVTISKMKSRELDIPRKVLILLFLATDGSETEYEEDEDEEPLTRDEIFQSIYTRLNRMLHACGFQQLDPRSPFDWMVLYCICVDDLWDVDQRLRDMLRAIYPAGNEK